MCIVHTVLRKQIKNSQYLYIFTKIFVYILQNLFRNVRVISYNILANLYLDLKPKQENLYFPYCAKEYQNYDYRYPILLREIPGMSLRFCENQQNLIF